MKISKVFSIKEGDMVNHEDRCKVFKWVEDNNKPLVKDFLPSAVMKGTGVNIKDVSMYCTELVKEGKLELRYFFCCECGFKGIYNEPESIPLECGWCDEKVDLEHDVFIGFAFKR